MNLFNYLISLYSLHQQLNHLLYILYHRSILLELQYVFKLISFLQFYLIYLFNMDHDNYFHQELYLSQLITQPKSYHFHQMQMDITIQLEYLCSSYIITFIQFLLYYFLIIYHESILLVFLYHYKLITLQQSIHIHNHDQNLYHLVSKVLLHIKPTIQSQFIYSHYSYIYYTIHLELEYNYILRSQLQYFHQYFQYLDHDSILKAE